MASNRSKQWLKFSNHVWEHIENYTVPQYGDAPHDQAETFTIEEVKSQLKRYVNRIGSNMRGEVEEIRDCYKIAHYACLLKNKLEKKNDF